MLSKINRFLSWNIEKLKVNDLKNAFKTTNEGNLIEDKDNDAAIQRIKYFIENTAID